MHLEPCARSRPCQLGRKRPGLPFMNALRLGLSLMISWKIETQVVVWNRVGFAWKPIADRTLIASLMENLLLKLFWDSDNVKSSTIRSTVWVERTLIQRWFGRHLKLESNEKVVGILMLSYIFFNSKPVYWEFITEMFSLNWCIISCINVYTIRGS